MLSGPSLRPLKNRPPGKARPAERLPGQHSLQSTMPSVLKPPGERCLRLTPVCFKQQEGTGDLYQLSAVALRKLGCGSCAPFCETRATTKRVS